jgi:hypothetical protein
LRNIWFAARTMRYSPTAKPSPNPPIRIQHAVEPPADPAQSADGGDELEPDAGQPVPARRVLAAARSAGRVAGGVALRFVRLTLGHPSLR